MMLYLRLESYTQLPVRRMDLSNYPNNKVYYTVKGSWDYFVSIMMNALKKYGKQKNIKFVQKVDVFKGK